MKYLIYPILLGNNNSTLFGVENDVIIIYNLFYKFYKLNDNLFIWKKPNILINENVKIENIIYLINQINNINNQIDFIIIIYFSGHSNSKGYLKFYNEKINSEHLLNVINSILKIPCELFFIIDSCFSKNFIYNKNTFNNIKKISYLVSCSENELSKEIEVDYNINMFKYKNINNKKKSKIIIGIFTFYFIKLMNVRSITNIMEFKNIVNDNLWKMISLKYKQTIYYEEL